MLTRPLLGSTEGASALAKGNDMIEGVSKSGPERIGNARGAIEAGQPVSAAGDASVRSRAGVVQSSVLDLVAEGPPIDSAKVDAIRAAIAEGRYPVDADKIAERMIALDLPRREA
jgi:negative regulator of flagellin synthesis FlgM